MQNVSAFGTSINIIATQTFPFGFSITQFSDDVDSLKIEEIEASAYEMLLDGSLFAYDKAAPVIVVIATIPGTDDDINLKTLLQTRKGSASVIPLPDDTSMIISYPTGTVAMTNGSILKGPLADSITQSGRFKGNAYTFAFGAFNGARNFNELVSVATNALGVLL